MPHSAHSVLPRRAAILVNALGEGPAAGITDESRLGAMLAELSASLRRQESTTHAVTDENASRRIGCGAAKTIIRRGSN